MTPEARSLIRAQYLEPKSALEVAKELNAKFQITDWITTRQVVRVWERQAEDDYVLRQLGERPLHGFLPSDKVELAKCLMVAA